MAEQALSTIGVVFGWGLGTMTAAPETWKQIEECISIGSVTLSQDKLDATPLESSRKKYVGGHAYHPSKKNMNVYIVEPGALPTPEYAVGSVLQYTITNTLVDLPDPVTAVKPAAPTAPATPAE